MRDAAHYVCNFLDAEGEISVRESIECANDEQAVIVALRMWEQRRSHHGMELWQGARRLIRHAAMVSFET